MPHFGKSMLSKDLYMLPAMSQDDLTNGGTVNSISLSQESVPHESCGVDMSDGSYLAISKLFLVCGGGLFLPLCLQSCILSF